MICSYRLSSKILSINTLSTLLLTMFIFTSVAQVHAQTLTIYESDKPAAFDPYMANDPASKRFVSLYCRPLFQFEYGRQLLGDKYLAVLADPNPVDNQNGLLVKIADDAYFHRYVKDPFSSTMKKDSMKVTAYDVVATYHNLINPESQLPSRWFGDRLNKFVQTMQALTDDSLWVVFKNGMKPSPAVKVLDFPVVPAIAVPDAPVERAPKRGTEQFAYMDRPWGAGPFVFKTKRDKNGTEIWIFERTNPSVDKYYGFIKMRVLDYQNMQTVLRTPHDDDVCIPSAPIGLRSEIHPDYRTEDLYFPSVEHIAFNIRKPQLADWRVRAALSVFIDRETLIKNYNSEAYLINGPFPKKYWYYCDDCKIAYHEQNIELGKQLLSEAGWIYDSYENRWMRDGKPLKIELIGYAGTQNSTVSLLVNAIAQGWQSFGIEAKPVTMTVKKYNERLREREFDAAFNVLNYEIYPRLDRYFLTDGKDNYSGLSDSTLDALWASLGTVSVAEIRNVWHAIHERIGNLVPSAFLWTPHNYAVYSRWVAVGHEWYPYNFIGRVEKWKYEEY